MDRVSMELSCFWCTFPTLNLTYSIFFPFFQTRGSVPMFWSQRPNLKYKPDPQIHPVQDHVSQTFCMVKKVNIYMIVIKIHPRILICFANEICLTHCGVEELGHDWYRWWLVASLVPSRYLKQCRFIVNWLPSNIFQWNFTSEFNIFIQENICKMIAIESRHQFFVHQYFIWCL